MTRVFQTRWRLFVTLVAICSLVTAFTGSLTAVSASVSSADHRAQQLDDLLDDTVDDDLDVVDDTADDAIDDSLDLVDDGGDDGTDDTILDDTVDDGLDLIDDTVDDTIDDELDVVDGTIDDTIDDGLDSADLLDDTVDDGLDLIDDEADGEDGDGLDDILAAALPSLTATACIDLDTDSDGVIDEAEADASASLDLNGNGTAGDADDLLLAELALGGGCDPLIGPTLEADVCIILDTGDDGVISSAELDAALTTDLDGDGTAGDLDDLLLARAAINGGCIDPGGTDPIVLPGLDVAACVILDADEDGVVLDSEIAALQAIDINGDGTIGDAGDLAQIQAAINGGCADPGSGVPPSTDPPVVDADICVILDANDDGIISLDEVAIVSTVDLDGDGISGDLDDLILGELAIGGGCFAPGGPGTGVDEIPTVTADICLILDANLDGVVVDSDIAAALTTDLDGSGTAGDAGDLALVQAVINGACATGPGGSPVDPPTVSMDVCVVLDADLDGVVVDADAAAAVLLDLDGDGTVGDLDDLILINAAVNGACAAGETDTDLEGTDIGDTDADGTDTGDGDDDDGIDAADADDTDTDAGDGDAGDSDVADTDATDMDSGGGDADGRADGAGTVTTLPSTGHRNTDRDSSRWIAALLVSALAGAVVLAMQKTSSTRKEDT